MNKDIIRILEARTSSGTLTGEEAEKLLPTAKNYLNHISLRRYIGKIETENLWKNTLVETNPIYPFFSGKKYDKAISHCRRYNKAMEEKYGTLDTSDMDIDSEDSRDTVFKRFILWQSVGNREEEIDWDIANGFALTTSGCTMGDRLPIGTAIQVVNASLFVELCELGREDLAEKIIK